jgi:hypothetical protein
MCAGKLFYSIDTTDNVFLKQYIPRTFWLTRLKEANVYEKEKKKLKKKSRKSPVAVCPLSHPHYRSRFQYEGDVFDHIFFTSNLSPPSTSL